MHARSLCITLLLVIASAANGALSLGALADSPSPSPSTSTSSGPPGLLADVCVELDAIAASPAGEDASPWAALAAWSERAADAARSAPVPRNDRTAAKAIATELDRVATDLRDAADGPPETQEAAFQAALDRLEAASRFAASTSLGSPLACADAPADDAGTIVEVSITDAGLVLAAPTAAGAIRLSVRNDSASPAGVALLELVAGTSVDDLVAVLSADDGDPTTVVAAQLAAVQPFEPSGIVSADLLLVPGDFALLALDDSGSVMLDPSAAVLFRIP